MTTVSFIGSAQCKTKNFRAPEVMFARNSGNPVRFLLPYRPRLGTSTGVPLAC